MSVFCYLCYIQPTCEPPFQLILPLHGKVTARGLKKRVEPDLSQALAKNRLLVITPFDSSVTRVAQETANKRNDFMAQLADQIFVAYAQPGGNVERVVMKWLKKGKKVSTSDVSENRALIDAGVSHPSMA